jgi:hypothetical protein
MSSLADRIRRFRTQPPLPRQERVKRQQSSDGNKVDLVAKEASPEETTTARTNRDIVAPSKIPRRIQSGSVAIQKTSKATTVGPANMALAVQATAHVPPIDNDTRTTPSTAKPLACSDTTTKSYAPKSNESGVTRTAVENQLDRDIAYLSRMADTLLLKRFATPSWTREFTLAIRQCTRQSCLN